MNKISNFFKSLFSDNEEEENEGFINVVTPELKTKVRFDVDEGMYCYIRRINGQIEIKLEKMEELI